MSGTKYWRTEKYSTGWQKNPTGKNHFGKTSQQGKILWLKNFIFHVRIFFRRVVFFWSTVVKYQKILKYWLEGYKILAYCLLNGIYNNHIPKPLVVALYWINCVWNLVKFWWISLWALSTEYIDWKLEVDCIIPFRLQIHLTYPEL